MLKRLFLNLYRDLLRKDYLQQAFGYYCVDSGNVSGELGEDIGAEVFIHLRKENIWPIEEYIDGYSEDDLFDLVELLWDWVSKPRDGYDHQFNHCGWHYETFDQEAGQVEYRQKATHLLRDYSGGYELSATGEVLALAAPGLQPLLDAKLPEHDSANVEKRVEAAIHKFRRHRSSLEDRKDAVRDLADVLEFLRPKAKEFLLSKKDDGDLFEIANSFAVRHHNDKQQSDYNKAIWYSWMFYFYLATIQAAVRVIKEMEPADSE